MPEEKTKRDWNLLGLLIPTDPTQALGVPKGSVRALLILSLAFTLELAVVEAMRMELIDPAVAIAAISAPFLTGIGFYFGQKNGQRQPPTP